jgi:Uma2 family endonuclease
MSTPPWPDHLLTLDEWDALPEDTSRHYELVEGVLTVSPHARTLHQRAILRLFTFLEREWPPDLCVVPTGDVVLDESWPPTVRCPDVVVVPWSVVEPDTSRVTAADVRLVVEVVEVGTRRRDRVSKLLEYAEAGIPEYWIAEPGEPDCLVAHRLVGDRYARVEPPAGLRLELEGLVRRRA